VQHSALGLNIKLQLYAAMVMSTAIYACETWKSTLGVQKKRDVFRQQIYERYWSYMERQGNQHRSIGTDWTEAFT